ncbi:MAG: hypothetical protein K2W82_05975 [Candidatus Obscuribacterales bacterium]|nr:hypothetical protein [Candidatus Obscuribacterales bacterium]
MKKQTISLLLATVLSSTSALTPAFSCAFSIDPYYTYSVHPDFPLKKYAAGELGILQPTYARSYLLTAYRYLSGNPLSDNEQASMVQLWDNRLTNSDDWCQSDTSAWLKERAQIPGATKIDSIDTEHSVDKENPWQSYCNCQTSAFETAAAKLKELVTKYGASSDQVKQWLKAQDDVFSNCGTAGYMEKPKPILIPEPLPATADPALQQDRNYQIAAANFYSQNFATARKEFDAIAADKNSPWSKLAPYLAARALVRQATLSKTLDSKLLAEAQQIIKTLLADPAYADMTDNLSKLESFIAVRLSPAEHLQELSQQKLTLPIAGEVTKTIDILSGQQDDDDSKEIEYAKLSNSLKAPDSVDWIMTFQSTDEAGKKHALEQWRKTASLPWLVAAVATIDGDDSETAEIINAAEKQNSSAAKWTLFYHVNRLDLEKDKIDLVRTRLDKVLSAPPADLSISSLNQLKLQRLALAKNLQELIRFGIQNPAGICTSGGIAGVPDNVSDIEKSGKAEVTPPLLTPELADVMDNKLPLQSLIQIASNQTIPANLRSHLAWTAWVRAVLIGDEAAAKSLAQINLPLNKAKQKLFQAYLSASNAESRKFAAVFLMLQFSSAQPNAGYGPLLQDSYGDDSGWWWAAKPIAKYDNDGMCPAVETFEPLFLTAAQKAQTAKELAKLGTTSGAPNYFCKTVLAFAKTKPNDERLPQALHFAVKSTRYGMTDEGTNTLSKQCFQLLHSRFKTSPWAKKTPYWY